MIKFTPKEKPDDRITDVDQLKHGDPCVANGEPLLFVEMGMYFQFISLTTNKWISVIDTLESKYVTKADFELTEL